MAIGTAAAWPSLEGAGAEPTLASLHLWGEIVGKTRLALSSPVNHWWHVPFYLTARGLGTSTIPLGPMVFDVELDLLSHELLVRTSAGAREALPLCEGPLAGFYASYMALLHRVGVDVALLPFTVEMPERVRLDRDQRLCHYDPDWASRFFRALVQADRLLKEFRGRFLGKASPVHFFWGGFDLAATRFSGRPAPRHPGGVPNVGDWVMHEAYSHEVSSAGFWPGDARFPQAAFYAYAYPEPAGFKDAKVEPSAARYEASLGEFLLPYEAVRTSRDPDGDVLAFLQSTYVPVADLAHWDRQGLERARP
jgi:hypothetical protein